jgi:alcohol dehydrogenase class IV
MLPAALDANRSVAEADLAILERAIELENASRFAAKSDTEAAAAFIERIKSICRAIRIPNRLSALGVREEHIPALVAQSRGNSMNGNPRDISDKELTEILFAQQEGD